jgi:polyhydroxyalkanoate synthesis regulator phasin
MDPVTGIVATKAIQGVTDVVSNTVEEMSDSDSSGFEGVLRSLLNPDQANNINEEELFAALLQERIENLKGADLGAKYQQLLAENKSELTRADGYTPVEDAANNALQQLVEDGDLTEEEASSIRSEAFTAAQLDDNTSALYDSLGSGEDPTIAVMDIDSALLMAKAKIEEIASGETTATAPSTTDSGTTTSGTNSTSGDEQITPDGNSIDGAGSGFLFKPESDSGSLVILIPAQLAHQVESVILKDEEGSEIEQGRSSGYANADQHGEREHFRFSKSGGEYPKKLTVEVKLADGSIRRYSIPDPSQRYD